MGESNNLLACPFCGSNAVSESVGRTGENKPFYYVECEKCEGMGPGHNKPRLAVEAWNVRAGAGRASQDDGGKQLVSSAWLDALVARRDYWNHEADEHERDAEISAARRCANRATGIAEAIAIITSASNGRINDREERKR